MPKPPLLHQVDAFTNEPFRGNPAAVCLLDAPRDTTWMQSVAAEMNLAETAFVSPENGAHRLRWLTPAVEVPRPNASDGPSWLVELANEAELLAPHNEENER